MFERKSAGEQTESHQMFCQKKMKRQFYSQHQLKTTEIKKHLQTTRYKMCKETF